MCIRCDCVCVGGGACMAYICSICILYNIYHKNRCIVVEFCSVAWGMYATITPIDPQYTVKIA